MATGLQSKRCCGYGLGLLVGVLGCSFAMAAAPKRVLVVHSFGRDVAPFSVAASAFRTALVRDFGEPVDLQDLTLEQGRFAEPEMEQLFADFLQHRYAARHLDLLVPVGAPAAAFVAKCRDRIWPDTPVLITTGDRRLLPPQLLAKNTTTVSQAVELPGMLEDILQLQPDTTNVVVVMGASPLEQFWERECQREFLPYTNRLSFSWTSHLSLEQLKERVSRLPPRSFILYLVYIMDAAGVPYENEGGLKALRRVANAPIFGYFQSQLGLGIIGGRLYPDEFTGAQAARVAIRILRGEAASQIPPQIVGLSPPTYDARELKRWGIGPKRLPPGSSLRFQQPGLWELYRWQIIALAGLGLSQTVLIALLLTNLFQRRKAEQAQRESEERLRLATAAAGVGVWMWQKSWPAIWATEQWRRIFDFPLDADVSFEALLQRIHPKDRPRVEAHVRQACQAQTDYSVEHRVVLPDGTQRWIYALGRLAPGTPTRGERMLGACVDITERKRSEQASRQLSGQLIHLQEQERARLARELHDDVTQRLARLAIDAGRAEQDVALPSRKTLLHDIREGLVQLSQDIHALSYQLHPSVLEDLGLPDALKVEAERFRRWESLPVQLKLHDLPEPVPPEAAICLFRVAQEALRNAARHARAHAVQVSLDELDSGAQLAVQDDGCGFNPALPLRRPSLGLASMRERVRLAGGELDIESAPGQGTTVLAWVPLRKDPNE